MKVGGIARERIDILFKLARKEYNRDRKELANRYVFIARKIAMKSNISIPVEHKKSFCKKCGSYWVMGKNVTKRIKKKIIE